MKISRNLQAPAYSALKVRAGRTAPNQILRSGDFELIVADDENGEGPVVQMMLLRADLEALARSHAAALEPNAEHWCKGERRGFLEASLQSLPAIWPAGRAWSCAMGLGRM